MLYFAFGSNMLFSRIQKRVPSVRVIATVKLTDHVFKFHKKGADGSAKADVAFTGNINHKVYGVLYFVSRVHKKKLDSVEGRHYGYETKWVYVTDDNGKQYKAFTYYATNIEVDDKPYYWYKSIVVQGAKDNKLPVSYIKRIQKMPGKVKVYKPLSRKLVSEEYASVNGNVLSNTNVPEADFPNTELYRQWEEQNTVFERTCDTIVRNTIPAKKKKKSKKKKKKKTVVVYNRTKGKRVCSTVVDDYKKLYSL